MLDLQPFVLALHLAQRLQLGCHGFVYFNTLAHDRSLAGQFAPTRQHEGVNVKRLGHIAYRHAGKLAQRTAVALNAGLYRYVVRGPGVGMGNLLSVRSGCPLNRRNYQGRLERIVSLCTRHLLPASRSITAFL